MAINKEYNDVQLDVKFTQASTRDNLVSEENISVSFGKLAKWHEALVPTGGSSGKILAWNTTGTAKWSDPLHPTITKSTDTTSTASPAHGGTFTTVDSVTRDAYGHVTKINTKTITLPANPVPSNNVTGSGTSGYLTKWNGTHTITNGPQLGSSTTTFLRNDGTWATPTDTNTTYTLGTSGNNVTLTPSSGSVQSITVPYAINAAQAVKLRSSAARTDSSVDTADTTPYQKYWVKIASCYTTEVYTDLESLWAVNDVYGNRQGILKVRARVEGTAGTFGNTRTIRWIVADSEIDVNRFAIVCYNNRKPDGTTASGTATVELWWKSTAQYASFSFVLLDETRRLEKKPNDWVLYDTSTYGQAALPTTGNITYSVAATILNSTTGNATSADALNLTHGNELNFSKLASNGHVWFGYRWNTHGTETSGGTTITTYKFGNANGVGGLAGLEAGTIYENGTSLASKYAAIGHTHSQYYDSAISRTANTVLAAPNGSNGGATFRKLVAADLPDHTHSYLPLSGGTMTGDITFTGVGTSSYPSKSKGIYWSGGTDAIDMYYNLRESDAGELIINMRDDSNVRTSFAYNGTVKSYIDTNGTYNGNASKTGIRWNAVSQGQKWSRLYYSETAVNVEGSNGILSISCTRGNVVVNAVFLVFVSHSGSNASHIIELASTNYSTIRCRVVSNSGGSYYFEIYDTANNIASGTSQTWHCCFVTLTDATLTTYTTFTDGSTIPSNFAAANDFTTTVGKASAAIKDISRSGTTFTATRQDGTTFTFTQQDNNTTYSANNGVGLSGTTFYNSGVRAVSTGSANGTISVNTNGTSGDVPVKGLGTAAYKASSDFAVNQTLANDTNLNNITTPGFYNCGGTNSVTNKPSNVDAFGLNVIHDASGQWYTQILYPNNSSPLIYVRNYNGSAWSGWNSIAIGSFLPSTTTYAASSSVGGPATYVELPRVTADAKSFPGQNKVEFKEYSNTSTNAPSSEWYHIISMQGADTRYGTQLALGMTANAVYYRNYTNGSTWINWQPLGRFTATPTSGQVVITDGTTGGIKSSGYTIAKSVPSNAVFTDHITTVTSSGSGNAVTAVSADANGALTVTKGSTFSLSTHTHNYAGSSSAGGPALSVSTAGGDVVLGTNGSSSDDSGDIVWNYGNGKEKARLWQDNTYTAKAGPQYRIYKSDGTGLYSGRLPLADGTSASGTWGISITGNAASATILQTARNIALAEDFAGSANFDGSGNISISGTFYRCSASSNNTANYPWHRIAYRTGVTGNYNDTDAIFMIRAYYNGGPFGIIKVTMRTNGSGANCQVAARWLVRQNIAVNDVYIAQWGTTGQSVYADIFLKGTTYNRAYVYQIAGSRLWTLVNSGEASDTTTSDKKTSTEVYASIAAAGTALHNQAYTQTVAGVDAGHVNSANSATYATRAEYVDVVASNEIRFYNDNQFKANNHFWLGYSWADGSHYTPSGGSDTSSTTAPNITEFVMGNCTAGGLASVHAKTFILGNGSSPTKSSKTTTITTAATTTDRTITLPDDSGTVALTSKTFNVTRGSSVSTATSGYWAAMCNSNQSGSTAVLPTSGKWWHVISMDWTNNDVKNWISQLAIATTEGSGVWWRRNNTGGTTIDSFSWHRLAEGNSSGAATNVATEVGNSAGARPVFYAYLGDNTRVVYNTNFTYNPSGNVLTATTFAGALSGNATSANKLNTNAGATNRPVYFSGGVPVQCNTPDTGSWFGGVPLIKTDGVMEIGKYIDFHKSNDSTADYDLRLQYTGSATGKTITLPSATGTAALLTKGTTSFWGLMDGDGSTSEWIRATSNGFIPSASAKFFQTATSSLGTNNWYFKNSYIQYMNANSLVLGAAKTADGAAKGQLKFFSGNASDATGTVTLECINDAVRTGDYTVKLPTCNGTIPIFEKLFQGASNTVSLSYSDIEEYDLFLITVANSNASSEPVTVTSLWISNVAGIHDMPLIWGGAPTSSGGACNVTSGWIQLSKNSGTTTFVVAHKPSVAQMTSSGWTISSPTYNLYIRKIFGLKTYKRT